MEDNREVRASLRVWLTAMLPRAEADRLAYHLGDLHGAFLSAARRIERLSELPTEGNSEELRYALAGLIGEFYEHMPGHLAGARADLEPWAERLFEDAELHGEP